MGVKNVEIVLPKSKFKKIKIPIVMLGKIWYNILCIVTFARACPYAPTRIYNKNEKNTLKKVALKLKEKRRYKQKKGTRPIRRV